MKLQFHTWSNPKNSFQMELFLLFKPKLQRFIWAGLFLLLTQAANAQVSGTVFRDFNANGIKDNSATFNETFVAGVTVTAYDAAGTPTATTTDASGAYSFTGLTLPLRIEFSGYQTSDYSAPKGNTNNTSVQFYTAASSAANFGVNYPSDYSQVNPKIALPLYSNGDATGNLKSIVSLDWNSSGNTPTVATDATNTQIGSVWGTCYNQDEKLLYSAAFLKRHVGLKNDLGSIYVTNYSTGSGVTTATPLINISNAGTITGRNLTGVGPTNTSRDPTSFTQVGKIGLGGIEISPDGNILYVLNLNTKAIVLVNLSGGTATEGASITVPNPGCSSNPADWRPFAVKYHRGSLFVGGVCSGETGGEASMRYYIYKYDLATSTWSSALLDQTLGYPKGFAQKSQCGQWNPWITTWSQIAHVESDFDMCHPQPILSDIEFDVDGDMILLFIDRLGHQTGKANLCTAGTASVVTAGTSSFTWQS